MVYKKSFVSIFFFLVLLSLTSCSDVKETTNKPDQASQDTSYVFDQLPVDTVQIKTVVKKQDSTEKENTLDSALTMLDSLFTVQIGAFTTKEKAISFQNEASLVLNLKLKVEFNKTSNLFVVQVEQEFEDKQKAEALRNEIWKHPEYKDAWVKKIVK